MSIEFAHFLMDIVMLIYEKINEALINCLGPLVIVEERLLSDFIMFGHFLRII